MSFYALNDRKVVRMNEPHVKGESFPLTRDMHAVTIEHLEHIMRRSDKNIRGVCKSGVSLKITDLNEVDVLPVDLALNTDYPDEVLDGWRNKIYQCEKSKPGETLLIYSVNTGEPYQFRKALVATPVWIGDIAQGRLTWNVMSLLADGEEIALLCRLLNRHGLFKF